MPGTVCFRDRNCSSGKRAFDKRGCPKHFKGKRTQCKGLSLVGAILNPEAFVIGGGVSKAGEMLFDYVRPYYEKYSIAPGLATKFTLATLGNDAGIYGAAAQLLASEA